VRERIERLTAQRDRLAHLASLATVLVIIRETNGPQPVVAPEQGVGGYFAERIGAAWHDGLVTLSNGAAWMVGVVVGGAIWWGLALIILVLLVRALRRPPMPPSPPPPPSAPPPPPAP
jgi:hypothetical protein